MLGDELGQETGSVTGMRVLRGEDGPRVEVSFQASGTLLGMHETSMGTYTSVRRPDGSLFGEGQGVVMTENGDMASWRGEGVGHFTGQGGAVSFRGAIYYETDSERLARLMGMAVMFEFEQDDSGKTQTQAFEWK